MATFLKLCQDMARESGAVGAAPSSVLNQTGRQGKCIEWVRDAWTQIQADQPDYFFLQGSFSQPLSINNMIYAPTSLGIVSFARWLSDSPGFKPVTIYESGNQAEETTLTFVPYHKWQQSYDRGVHDPNKPIVWSIAPDRSLVVGPKPDKAYILRGSYQRGPQELAADNDVPIMPSQYHQIVVWRACMNLAASDEAQAAYAYAKARHDPILLNMQRDLLPSFETGGNALDCY
jgi:hypothetical protein